MRTRYREKVLHYFNATKNIGTFPITEKNIATGKAGNITGGDVVQLQIKFNEQGIVDGARFKAYGSAATIAICAWLTEWLEGKNLSQIQELNHTMIMAALELPATKAHCALLVMDALSQTIVQF